MTGESSVGKSSIALRFVKDQFDDFRESTIGAAFLTQTVRRDEDTTVKLEIWYVPAAKLIAGIPLGKSDTNRWHRCTTEMHTESLEKAKGWIRELQRHADANIVIALVGNKLDLGDTRRMISTEDGAKYAESEGLMFMETSAKTPTNITELFDAITKKLPLDRGMGAAQKRQAGTNAAAATQQGRGTAPVQLNAAPPRQEDACGC
ncbi:GTP-binding protein of the rab/ypt [Malassezia vespertilionis]|uniref:GTP-binding protein of the rab/ypt n=1 Tax=Malassezia vespertilionis TaxID=2020962 RepID=UPI0024B16401|nr:GTP-binding protein of the rab/ypt [Malassezia vespertilionis]WFD07802.1 GTP-binding protein of the rab/ypt [Malassezia vespertilionis]